VSTTVHFLSRFSPEARWLRDERNPGQGFGILNAFRAASSARGFVISPWPVRLRSNRLRNRRDREAVSAQATGINPKGDIVGWLTRPRGAEGFILKADVYQVFSYPKSTSTEALGLNFQEQIVGSYVDTSGVTHGFLLSGPASHPQWQSFDNPKANGSATLTGINSRGDVVGNYFDKSGNTLGFLCS
jgi:hypothetical protein